MGCGGVALGFVIIWGMVEVVRAICGQRSLLGEFLDKL